MDENNQNNSFDGWSSQENPQGNYAYQTVMEIKSRSRGFAIASLVLGILSLVCCCISYAGLVMATLAIIFAIVSRKKMGYFDSLAIAGLIVGIIGVIFGAFSILVDVIMSSEEFWIEFEKMYPEIYEQMQETEGAGGTNSF